MSELIPQTGPDVAALIRGANVIDLETTLNSDELGDKGFSGSFNSKKNTIVAMGIQASPFSEKKGKNYIEGHVCKNDSIAVAPRFRETYQTSAMVSSLVRVLDSLDRPMLLVGHNIAFDIGHLIADFPSFASRTHKILLWDTMIAEYLLSAQEQTYVGLEKACERYGIPFEKDDEVTTSFKLGIGSDCINPEILLDYMREDVSATSQLFMKQHNAAHADGGLHAVKYMIGLMTARLPTLQAEVHGMYVDKIGFDAQKLDLQNHWETLKHELQAQMRVFFPAGHTMNEITPSSPKQVGLLLYGGSFNVAAEEVIYEVDGLTPVMFKSGPKKGTIKTKKVTDTRTFSTSPLIQRINARYPASANPPCKAKNGTSTKVLNDILDEVNKIYRTGGILQNNEAATVKFIDKVLEFRKLDKNFGTYYEGLEKHFWEASGSIEMVKIHPKYNHNVTKTKRLSSSSPNMQNVSNKETQDT
jgi:DNA polymerase I-like protein with 3'-5' exonuclease and polymerase domains